MSRDNSVSTPWWEQDASVLLGNGIYNRVDEKTIHHTPIPLASSTVLKNPDGKDKPPPPRHSLFMNEDPEETPSKSGEEIVRFSLSDLDLMKDAPGKSGERSGQKERDLLMCTDPFMKVQKVDNLLPYSGRDETSANTRTSSMGIIPLDSLQDLSSSLLHYDISGENTPKPPAPSTVNKEESRAKMSDIQSESKPRGVGSSSKLAGKVGLRGMFLNLNDDIDEEEELLDASVPVIQFTEDDLKKLDDEFGDFDFNSTMTDDLPDQSRASVESRDFDRRKFRDLPERPSEIFGRHNTDVPNRSTLDSMKNQNRFVPVGNASDISDVKVPFIDTLDPQYLRASPKPSLHEDGDGEEDQARPRFSQTSLFPDDTGSGGLENTASPAGRMNIEPSEIDTEDEIEAVRRDLASDYVIERRDTPGASEDDRVPRPGLEGARSSDEGDTIHDDFMVRQNAEGEVMASPVPGDGGGGGDGTSASEDETLRQNGPLQSNLDSLLHTYNPSLRQAHQTFEEDDPSAQPRIQPVGEDDDLGERLSHQVRFTDVYDEESRDIPGSSERYTGLENTNTGSQGSDSGGSNEPVSHLESRFLRPRSISSLMATPSVGDQRTSWSIEQSTFNLDNVLHSAGDGEDMNDQTLTPNRASVAPSGYGGQQLAASPGNSSLDMMPSRSTSDLFSGQPSLGSFTQPNLPSFAQPNRDHNPDTTDMIFTGQSSLGSFGLAQKNQSGKDDGPFPGSFSGMDFSELMFKASPVGSPSESREEAREEDRRETLDTTGGGHDESPVYFNEEGEGVTDLAYHTTLTGTQEMSLGDFENELMPTAESHAMMAKHEKEFGGLTQDESVRKTNSVSSSGSWSLRSEGSVLRPSWMSAEEAEEKFLRISIGTFMRGRTEALGSLDGEEGVKRPEFGRTIVTPPSARKPFALIQASPNLSDIQETTDQEDRNSGGVGYFAQKDRISGAGDVRLTLDIGSLDGEKTDTSTRNPEPSPRNIGQDSTLPSVQDCPSVFPTPTIEKTDLASSGQSAQSSDRSDREDTFMNKSGAVNISAISKLLANASINAKPEELAAMILKLSYEPHLLKQKLEESQAQVRSESPVAQEGKTSNEGTGRVSDKPPIPSKIPALDATIRPSRTSFPRYSASNEQATSAASNEQTHNVAEPKQVEAPKNEKTDSPRLSYMNQNKRNDTAQNKRNDTAQNKRNDAAQEVKPKQTTPQNTKSAQNKLTPKSNEVSKVPKKDTPPSRGLPRPRTDLRRDSPLKSGPVKTLKLKPPPARRPQDVSSSDEEGPQPRPPRKTSSRKKGKREEGAKGTASRDRMVGNTGSPSLPTALIRDVRSQEQSPRVESEKLSTTAPVRPDQAKSQIPRRTRSESPPKPAGRPNITGLSRIPRPVSSSRSRSRSADREERVSPEGPAVVERSGERMSRRDKGPMYRMEPVQEVNSPQWERQNVNQEVEFETGNMIPQSPPVGWNTPRPSSVYSRTSTGHQSNDESPPPPTRQALSYSKSSSVGVVSPSLHSPKYNYNGTELTSGFHSQPTDFLQTHNQTPVSQTEQFNGASSLNNTPNMHRLVPRYDSTPNGDRSLRGPRLSSTPMYGTAGSPPLHEMPSNIVASPGTRMTFTSDSLDATRQSHNPPPVSTQSGHYDQRSQGHEELVQGRMLNIEGQNLELPQHVQNTYGANLKSDRDYFTARSAASSQPYPSSSIVTQATYTYSQTRPITQSDLRGTATTYVHGPAGISAFTSQANSRAPAQSLFNQVSHEPMLASLQVQELGQERYLRTAPQYSTREHQGHGDQGATFPREFRELPATSNVLSPSEVKFQDVCCVGMTIRACIPLQNPNNRWLHCTLRIVTINIDGRDRAPSLSPFVLKQQVIIGPKSVEDIEVIFAPRTEGVYVAHLHLIISPIANDCPLQPVSVPTMVTLQAVAETPNIQVVCNGEGVIDFGQLPWASQTSIPLTLINRGRATVPVRLVITGSTTSWHHFSFEPFTDTANEIMPTQPKSVISTTIHGRGDNSIHGDPVQIILHLRTPDRQFERGHHHLPPENLRARVDVELDVTSTSTMLPPLYIVNLQAVVGNARLRAPATMQTITLKTTREKSTTHILPLQNAGNIQLKVSFSMTEHDDVFIILPSQLEIDPGNQADVVIKFKPKSGSQEVYQSMLLMHIEPSGPAYEIDVTGEVTNRPSTRHSSGMVLLSNKHFLSWGGVNLREAAPQQIVLRNPTSSVRHFKMLIKGQSQEFKIRHLHYGQEELVSEREIMMKPMEDYPITIIYEPSVIAPASAKLNIKMEATHFKYSIPLVGYGGTCAIVVDDANDSQRGHYWVNSGEIREGCRSMVRVTLRNRGVRPGYIKALTFTDMNCKKKLSNSIMTVQPSEFVIHEKETKVVLIVINPSNREASLCRDGPSLFGAIAFYCGDEISRQRYRRSVQKDKKSNRSLNISDALHGVNFDVSYQGDELLSKSLDVSDTPNDVDLFYSSMSRVVVSLVGDPPKPSQTYNPRTLGAIENGLGRMAADNVMCTPPVKGTPASQTNPQRQPVSMKSLDKKEDWNIKPEQMILSSPRSSTENNVKRLQINNFTDQTQQFEFTWPAHCISVTPEEGSIPARSSALICISANPTLHSRGIALPWRGQVHIFCASSYKVLKVQIRDDPILDDISPTTHRHKPLVTVVEHNRPVKTTLVITSKELTFPETIAGTTADHSLEMLNNEEHEVEWSLTPFAPAYVKDPSSRGEMHRLTYPVFQFLKTSGKIEPGQSLKVPVIFMPHEVGSHSQFFDLIQKVKAPVAVSENTTRVQCMGQSISHLSAGLVNGLPENERPKTKKSTKEKSTRNKGIVVSSEKVVFPVLRSGESEILRVAIKNHATITEMVEVIPPELPFKVTYHSLEIKSRHYLRLPVEFAPDRPGEYTTELVLRSSQNNISVQLHGQAE